MIALEAQSGRRRAQDKLQDQNVVGEMTLWGNRERYGQGYQQGRGSWTLAEGYTA